MRQISFAARLAKGASLPSIMLLFMLLALNIIWIHFITSNNVRIDDHSAGTQIFGMNFIDHLHADKLDYRQIMAVGFSYPPLQNWLGALSFFLFGFSTDSPLIMNLIFLNMMVLSLYGIGKALFGELAGLIAAMILCSSALILRFALEFSYLEFTLASLLTLSMLILIKTDGFRHKGYAIALGVFLGLCSLVKFQFILYLGALAVAVYYMDIPALIAKSARRWLQRLGDRHEGPIYIEYALLRLAIAILLALALSFVAFQINSGIDISIPPSGIYMVLGIMLFFIVSTVFFLVIRMDLPHTNLILSACIVFLIAFWWYYPSLPEVAFHVTTDPNQNALSLYTGPSDSLSIYNLLAYAMILINDGYSLMIFILLCASLGFGIIMIRRGMLGMKEKQGFLMIAAWFLIAYAMLTAIKLKYSSFAVPLLPAIALLAAFLIVKVRYAIPRVALVVVLALFMAINNLNYVLGIHGSSSITLTGKLKYDYKVVDYFDRLQLYRFYEPRYDTTSRQKSDAIINDIIHNMSGGLTDPAKVLVLMNTDPFSSTNLVLTNQLSRRRYISYELPDNKINTGLLNDWRRFLDYDFVLTKSSGFNVFEKQMNIDRLASGLLGNSTEFGRNFFKVTEIYDQEGRANITLYAKVDRSRRQ